MMSRRAWWLATGLLFTLAFSLRVAAGLELLSSPLECGLTQMWDARHYHGQAWEIAAGDWLGHEVFYLAPLYPYALGLLYAILDSSTGSGTLGATMVFQALLGAGSVLLIASLGRRFGGRTVGLLAGASAALYEPFIYQESLVMPTALVLFTHVLALRLFIAANDRPDFRLWPIAGFGLGVASLAHGSGLALAALLAATSAVTAGRGSTRRNLAAAGLLLVGLSIPILSVTARNWMVGSDLVLVTSNAGKNFYIGHHPEATGTFAAHHLPVWGSGLGTYLEEVERGPEDPAPSEVSAWLADEAWGFIRDDPGRAVRVTIRKLRLLFNWYETPINDNQYFARRFSNVLDLPLLSFGLIAPFGLAGLVLGLRCLRGLSELYVATASQVGVFALMFVLGRYRAFLAAMVMIAAALFVRWMAEALRERRWRALGPAILLLSVAASFVNQSVPGFERSRGFGQQHLAVARHYLEEEKPKLADRHAKLALRSSFAPWRDLPLRKAKVQYMRGKIAKSSGEIGRARKLFDRAMRRAKGEPWHRDAVRELIANIQRERKNLVSPFHGR
jgi:4-amino-4-deoxy-L-arabinose transferase-like glycosyltransferase